MQLIENAINYVKEMFKNEYSGHDYFHTIRVYKMALRISEEENADTLIISLAALLHDVDDIKLSPQTSKNKDNARKFLTDNNIDSTTIDLICEIIDEISYKGSESVSPKTLEGKCVQDADRLDAIGAIGIARAFAYGGNHNRVMHDPNEPPTLSMSEDEYRNHVSTTINHFYEKLFNLKDLMNTKTAIKIAEERNRYMKEYIIEFMNEWDGIK